MVYICAHVHTHKTACHFLLLLIVKNTKNCWYHFQVLTEVAALQFIVCSFLFLGCNKRKKYLLYVIFPFRRMQENKNGKEFPVVFLTANFSECRNPSFLCDTLLHICGRTWNGWPSLFAWVIIHEYIVLH